MAEFKTSFIPKKPTLAVSNKKTTKGTSVFTFVSFVVFLLTLVIAGGLYLYQTILNRNVSVMIQSIDRVREAVEPDLIASLSGVDRRIRSSVQLLDKHHIVSPIFRLLEDLTLETVRYGSFQYIVSEQGELTINLRGEAKDYSSLALQSDIFGDEPTVISPIFENLNINLRGNVSFEFSAVISESLILYKNNFNITPRFKDGKSVNDITIEP